MVTITGTNLTGATSVRFGSVAATSVKVASATSATAVAPAGHAGPVDVRVITPGGTSTAITADRFTYTPAATWHEPQVVDPAVPNPVSVSCPTATFCAEVDQTGNVATSNGTSWSEPVHITSEPSELTRVSCASAIMCVAIDQSGQTFRFDGTTWSGPSQPFPGPNKLLLNVWCFTNTFCMGYTYDGAVTFDGTTWSAPAQISPERIMSISCASTDFCVAVDYHDTARTFDGTNWSERTPLDLYTMMAAVDCPTTTFCVAAASNGRVFTFDGTSWSGPTDPPLRDSVTALEWPSTNRRAHCVWCRARPPASAPRSTAWEVSSPSMGQLGRNRADLSPCVRCPAPRARSVLP